jgi:superfamily I DNA/RNA helicase
VLLTTVTNALAASLRDNLSVLLDGDASLLARVDVTTVNAYAHGVVSRLSGKVLSPIGDREERQVWKRVIKKHGLPWNEQFLAPEYRHVILAQDLRTLDAYRAAARRGRGTALSPARREQLWPAVESFESMLREQRTTTHLMICARAAELLAASLPTHDHVVVDEAQDLHPAQWRVLRGAVAPGNDDLFVTGDPHQRIYDSKVSLGSLGISVTGRTHRLRLNYRSTEEILSRRPQVEGYGSEQAEVTTLVERVEGWIAQGIRPSEIGVCAHVSTCCWTRPTTSCPRPEYRWSASGTIRGRTSRGCDWPRCTPLRGWSSDASPSWV